VCRFGASSRGPRRSRRPDHDESVVLVGEPMSWEELLAELDEDQQPEDD
jgi:hypothetical protein